MSAKDIRASRPSYLTNETAYSFALVLLFGGMLAFTAAVRATASIPTNWLSTNASLTSRG